MPMLMVRVAEAAGQAIAAMVPQGGLPTASGVINVPFWIPGMPVYDAEFISASE